MPTTDPSLLYRLPFRSSAPYRIELFGELRVTVSGSAPVTRFRTRKAALLLAYLALFPRRHSRETLVDLFWPELTPDAGRDNLSGCLSSLRRQFAGENAVRGGTGSAALVLADRGTVRLNTGAATVDAAAFEALLDSSPAAAPPCAARRKALEEAVALYRGPLLGEVYEDWALNEQTRLRERFSSALAALADVQRLTGDAAAALVTARRAQAEDPLAESAYQTEMRLLASQGRVESARRVFHDFEQRLRVELGCRPSRALVSLLEQLPLLAQGRGESCPAPAEPGTPAPVPVPVPVTELSPPGPLSRKRKRGRKSDYRIKLSKCITGGSARRWICTRPIRFPRLRGSGGRERRQQPRNDSEKCHNITAEGGHGRALPLEKEIRKLKLIRLSGLSLWKKAHGPKDRRRHPRRRESSAEAEAAALVLAIPLRPMVGCIDGGMRYVLGCGHTVSSNAVLDAEVRARCRECYREGMLGAERMLVHSPLHDE